MNTQTDWKPTTRAASSAAHDERSGECHTHPYRVIVNGKEALKCQTLACAHAHAERLGGVVKPAPIPLPGRRWQVVSVIESPAGIYSSASRSVEVLSTHSTKREAEAAIKGMSEQMQAGAYGCQWLEVR